MPQEAQIAVAVAAVLTGLWGGFVVWWSFVRPGQAGPAVVEEWARTQGYRLIRCECRWPSFRFSGRVRAAVGPFAGHLWGGRAVFWIEVMDGVGQHRHGWLRLGTPWSLRGPAIIAWDK